MSDFKMTTPTEQFIAGWSERAADCLIDAGLLNIPKGSRVTVSVTLYSETGETTPVLAQPPLRWSHKCVDGKTGPIEQTTESRQPHEEPLGWVCLRCGEGKENGQRIPPRAVKS
jgi:hypothetical protein